MSTIFFAPHSTARNLFSLHIPIVATEVERGDARTIPGKLRASLSVTSED